MIDLEQTRLRYSGPGRRHYESLYVKANHPSRRLGAWLKFNLLAVPGQPLEGELWGVFFDGEAKRISVASRVEQAVTVEPQAVRIAGAELAIDTAGLREHADLGAIRWELSLTPSLPGMDLLPYGWMYRAGFPKKKINTPVPLGLLGGWLEVDGVRHDLSGWRALHGHNWGTEHAFRYAYGNAAFADGGYVDGFTARILLGGLASPWLSCVVARLPDGRELRFDRPVRWTAGDPQVAATSWTLDLPGAGGLRARLAMRCAADDMVGLVYRYPDGRRVGHCLNTKFAETTLRVTQRGVQLYEATTSTGELETFGPAPEPGFSYHALQR